MSHNHLPCMYRCSRNYSPSQRTSPYRSLCYYMNYDHIADIHSHVHNDCHHILQEQPNIIHIHLYSFQLTAYSLQLSREIWCITYSWIVLVNAGACSLICIVRQIFKIPCNVWGKPAYSWKWNENCIIGVAESFANCLFMLSTNIIPSLNMRG